LVGVLDIDMVNTIESLEVVDGKLDSCSVYYSQSSELYKKKLL